VALRITKRVTVDTSSSVAIRIRLRADQQFTSEIPAGMALEQAFRTTPGTVPGTVRTVVPGTTFWTVLTVPKVAFFSHLG